MTNLFKFLVEKYHVALKDLRKHFKDLFSQKNDENHLSYF